MHVIDSGQTEKVILAGLHSSHEAGQNWELYWAELRGLVETAGGEVVSEVIQNRDLVNPSTVFGSGKIKELAAVCEELSADMVVFQGELTPAQVRTLDRILPCRVIDRTQVILDIFAERARSHEGKLQVEFAQLKYLLPRLSGKGAALSRLGAGIGTRGPGETKLETDRRHIRSRMDEIREHIKQVGTVRKTQRQTRLRNQIPRIALVGYTNSGKTSLLRALIKHTQGAESEIVGRNRLFDTLDPTSRKLNLQIGKEAVITDTVGFIQQLPHSLIDAFRSTLEETLEADLLLHVVDASHPFFHQQMETVYQVLDEIRWAKCPVITVYNKIDLVPGLWQLPDPKSVLSIRTSTETGIGLDQLVDAVRQTLSSNYIQLNLLIPFQNGDVLARLYQGGWILKREEMENGTHLEVKIPQEWENFFLPFHTT
ncbi:MAG: GTPase HflX [Bacilli bacterium]|nr:GTPase HflX [Bacilli bacterium]